MKSKRFNESQIFQALKEAEAGIPVPELCRKHGMSSASFYKWRQDALAGRLRCAHHCVSLMHHNNRRYSKL